MPRFDWPAFLRRHGIEYVTGTKSSRHHVNVHCPQCGNADTGHHLGIHLYRDSWSCWRTQAHRGIGRARLIQMLVGCTSEEAHRLAGTDDVDLPEGDVASLIRHKLLGEASTARTRLELPREFKPLVPGLFATRFVTYLRDRGYHRGLLDDVSETYDLHYATRGRWSYRIVIPVCDRNGRLLTWTGRTILPEQEPRYLALSAEAGLTSIYDTVLGLDMLWAVTNPKALLVMEGPFDAMWVTMFGRSMGVYGTCLFGLNLSSAQALLIQELRRKFDRVGFLLDSAAVFQTFRLAQNGMGLDVFKVPAHRKDPAVMSPNEVIDLCLSVI